MKIISWNVRDYNNKLKKRLLRRKIEMEKPIILFLQETKCSSEDLGNFGKRFWKGAEVMELDMTGATGGLGLLWSPKLLSMTNFVASRYMLSTCFDVLGISIRGVITNVYGPFQLAHKPTFLEEM